jgi:hypothetical protein
MTLMAYDVPKGLQILVAKRGRAQRINPAGELLGLIIKPNERITEEQRCRIQLRGLLLAGTLCDSWKLGFQ